MLFYSRRYHSFFIGCINYYWYDEDRGKNCAMIKGSKTLDKLLTIEQEDHHADEFGYGAPKQVVAKNFQRPIALPPADGNAQLEFALVGLPSASKEDRAKYIQLVN